MVHAVVSSEAAAIRVDRDGGETKLQIMFHGAARAAPSRVTRQRETRAAAMRFGLEPKQNSPAVSAQGRVHPPPGNEIEASGASAGMAYVRVCRQRLDCDLDPLDVGRRRTLAPTVTANR